MDNNNNDTDNNDNNNYDSDSDNSLYVKKLNKCVSSVRVLKSSYTMIDYIYYNNLLYVLYNNNNKINLILYDVNKYKIIRKYKSYYIAGCFNDNKLYVLNEDLTVLYIELITISKIISDDPQGINIEKDRLEFIFNYYMYMGFNNSFSKYFKKHKKNYVVYIIENKLYLCYDGYYDDDYYYLKILNYTDNKIYSINVNDKYYSNMDNINENIYKRYYQINNNIYLNCYYYTYIFNIKTKKFKTIKNNISFNCIYYKKISKTHYVIENKLYNYINKNIIKLHENNEDLYIYNYYRYYIHESNKLVDNKYFLNNKILIETNGTISNINKNDECITFTNGENKLNIPKNVLIHRSGFFKDMFKDLPNINKEIKFDDYNKLEIYLEYITSSTINNKNEIYNLFEICILFDDCDIKHLANNLLLYGRELNVDNLRLDINKLRLLYKYDLKSYYYQLICNMYYYYEYPGQKIINYLKNDKYNNNNFYIDTIEHIFNFA